MSPGVPFEFPDNPVLDQEVIAVGGIIYVWDGIKWISGVSPMVYLPIGGGTMTGPLILARDPQLPLEAATMQWVQNYVASRPGTPPAGSHTQIQWNNNGAFGASGNLVWDNVNSRLGVGAGSPSTNLQIFNPGLTTMIMGDPANGGTLYLAATGAAGLGLVSFTTNATFTGSAWAQTDPDISSWQMAFRNAPVGSPEPGTWSIRYKPPGDPPNLFPVGLLTITDTTGYIGINNDAPQFGLDVHGDCRISKVPIPQATLPAPAPNHSWLIVGPIANDGTWGIVTASGNSGSAALPVGSFAFTNYAISGAEKRIAELTARPTVAMDHGEILFNTAIGGVLGLRMSVGGDGVRIGHAAFAGAGGDLGVSRDGSVFEGAIFFGNVGNAFLYFDGTNFLINCPGTLLVNGVPI